MRRVLRDALPILLLTTACDGDARAGRHEPATASLALSEDDADVELPSAEWVPGYTWSEPAALPVTRTFEEIASENEALLLVEQASHTPAALIAKLLSEISGEAYVAIVEHESTEGLVGANAADRVQVKSIVVGDDMPASVVVLQPAGAGKPYSCGGLEFASGRRYAVVLSHSEGDHYRLVMNYDALVFGWGVETEPGKYFFYGGYYDVTDADLLLLGV